MEAREPGYFRLIPKEKGFQKAGLQPQRKQRIA
jgi:hypothetical protein